MKHRRSKGGYETLKLHDASLCCNLKANDVITALQLSFFIPFLKTEGCFAVCGAGRPPGRLSANVNQQVYVTARDLNKHASPFECKSNLHYVKAPNCF